MIVTRQKVKVPNGAHHVRIAAGDFFGAESMSDEELRRLYNQACAVVVPLKDVWQPSGYSVTLQAMSCGRPVILTKTRGLWAPDLLHDGGNCLLVPPGDAAALGAAVGRLRSDPVLAARLGRAARATVLAHFGLERSGAETVALARRGLALSRGRHSADSGQLRSGVGTSRSSGRTG
jgi:glycosyltransferase involved in cell wall biosynthesis